MGTRIKTFDATGNAPNGRLYAGDLNAIQDQYSDLVNYAQNHGVGTLAIGESGLQLLRYAAGEARLTGAMRVDGILRGLGGLYAGAFTTTQRNAIVAGKRPYGLAILNSTVNRFEWNRGSDAVPDWQPFTPDVFPVGFSMPYFGEPASMSGEVQPYPGWLLCNGASVAQADYPELFTHIGFAYGNPGGGNFNLPNCRARSLIGKNSSGTFQTRGQTGGEESHTLILSEIATHNHTQLPHNHTQDPHSHPHDHGLFDSDGDRVRETDVLSGGGSIPGLRRGGTSPVVDAEVDATVTEALNQAAIAVNVAAGGNQPHNNMPPHLVIGGWLIKAKMV